jgi:hypothetical protein
VAAVAVEPPRPPHDIEPARVAEVTAV